MFLWCCAVVRRLMFLRQIIIMICTILSVGCCRITKCSPWSGSSKISFLLSGPFPYVHITENKMYWKGKEMFYLTTHSTHFIYGYMASDIWLRTILIVRKETHCRHIGYSFRWTARVLLYAPSHRQDSTYHRPLLHKSWSTGGNFKMYWVLC